MRKTSALLMSVILAASTSLSVFAAPSPTARTTNTVVAAQATQEQKEEVARNTLRDSGLIAAIEAKVPTTTDGATGEKIINNDLAATAEAIATTEGASFYSIDTDGNVFEVGQENVVYNMLSGNLKAEDQRAAESDPNYVGTVSFATTDLRGNVIASVVEDNSRGYSPRFNTLNAWKFLGGLLSQKGVTYEQFAANPSIYKVKTVSGNRLVDTDLVRWVVEDGRPVLVVNYRAFSSDGYVVVVQNDAEYGYTGDSVPATVTGTATNPHMDPNL